MTDQTYTPDPDLVRRLTALVVDDAISELRDTGVMAISEICAEEIEHLPYDQQDAIIRAVKDTLSMVAIDYALPGGAPTWTDERDNAVYPLDRPMLDPDGGAWTLAGWMTYLGGRAPDPLLRCGDAGYLLGDLIDKYGPLTPAPAEGENEAER